MDTKLKIEKLFSDQLSSWELAKNNYTALSRVKVKELDVNGTHYKVQFNPTRIVSSAAKVDTKSIQERKCFLCPANLPAVQRGLPFKENYQILVNPFPIFPKHLTVPALEHVDQRIKNRFGDMLDLATYAQDYVVFYNGPKCGASAPDHVHFQAGNKGFLPLEQEWKPGEEEPMMNLLTWVEGGQWVVCIFPRSKHRPSCYTAEGDANILISPASVDMGGVFITPLEKDFEKLTATDIAAILGEVCLSTDEFYKLRQRIKEQL